MARRRRRHRRKGRFAFLYKLMTFLLICGALVAALALFFKVESIEITGTSRYSTDEVERASGVHVGDNLYLMDKKRRRLTHHAAAAICRDGADLAPPCRRRSASP